MATRRPRRRPVAIVLFARIPRRGAVKTRLVPPLTRDEALGLHVALLTDAAAAVRGAARSTGAVPYVSFSAAWRPPARGPLASLRVALRGLSRHPQGTGDLGRRMRGAIRALLRRGHAAVVVVGSDAPLLGPAPMARAARALAAGAPVVVTPTVDGGYCLIGLGADRPGLFRGIPWGTAAVWRRTRERLRRAGLTPLVLPRSRDVDRPADLAWLGLALAGGRRRRAPATAAFLSGSRAAGAGHRIAGGARATRPRHRS